ncbi:MULTISPECIES: multidrug effflux MFS transporter [unclassified Neptuniibacter]|jgi:DHA1 family bicyclomycin/chloramphenicol resistance-like MFS transporter|uniref:multidrug effflux MFS transporter n=1 Tax=unclassified Neptuniibacter TaxID=2630693 RepID=UPI0026E48129|nr:MULTISPECIES: multidrug effflux MFS transporter [unclassified Neptuniibacter]MDO6513689.1 multidrug effflux MFS transporter [Neptuniibacter sp. 2_MG-2023]MDO6593830.1 multidrug effflux MFS transporter [Neptuniibacter sp. 1_MG-2023]
MKILQTRAEIGFTEFVALMAFVTCFVAMSIDLMLPALFQIGQDLGVQRDNDTQLIVSTIFIGVAIGHLIYGPLADVIGRKPSIYLGFAIFILGTLISLFAVNMSMMLVGRLLQGLGAAGPRIVTIAIVRDKSHGSEMARVMSLIMTVFILVPVIAPIIGQGILLVSNWRMMFAFLFFAAVFILIWFALRLPESLPLDQRSQFSVKSIVSGCCEVVTNRVAMAYVIASGLGFGAFLGFLSSIQQVLQDLYHLGAKFPLYFAVLATGIGVASFINSKLVMRFGLRQLVMGTQVATLIISIAVLISTYWLSPVPPLWFVMGYFLVVLMGIGLLFGNLNALSMEPFGHIAGLASGVIGGVSTLIAVVAGVVVGQAFNETLVPIIVGFILLPGLSLLFTYWASRRAI